MGKKESFVAEDDRCSKILSEYVCVNFDSEWCCAHVEHRHWAARRQTKKAGLYHDTKGGDVVADSCMSEWGKRLRADSLH